MIIKLSYFIFSIMPLMIPITNCTPTSTEQSASEYDSHKIKVQFLSFFNQRISPSGSSKKWKGDWLFRRERLTLIEKELSEMKPDLNIFQSVMSRGGNSYESDIAILGSGVFKGYKNHAYKVQEYPDTNETESHAFSISPPLHYNSQTGSVLSKDNNYLSWDIFLLDKEPLLAINLELKEDVDESILNFFTEEMKKVVSKEKICTRRVLVAASIPPDAYKTAMTLTDAFNLQDASKGFCSIESTCYTAHPSNQIFLLTHGQVLPSRYDFIFVPSSSKVTLYKINFNEASLSDNGYFKNFGLTTLWPSDRFGLRIDLYLAKCM